MKTMIRTSLALSFALALAAQSARAGEPPRRAPEPPPAAKGVESPPVSPTSPPVAAAEEKPPVARKAPKAPPAARAPEPPQARQATPPAREEQPIARQEPPQARQETPPARQETPPAKQEEPPAKQEPKPEPKQEPKPEPKPEPAPEPKAEPKPAAEEPAPSSAFDAVQSGDRVRVKLRGGRAVDGVVLAKDGWERRDRKSGWVAAQRDHKEAGLRLWWVQDLDGFQFVFASDVVELRSLGAVPPEELDALANRRKNAAEETEKNRERVDAEKVAAADAEAKAKDLSDQVEEARRAAEEAEMLKAKEKADAIKAVRWSELLAQFPPAKWTPETPKDIERRKITLDVFPSEEETAFLAVFEEWKEAYDAWKAAQDRDAEEKSAGK